MNINQKPEKQWQIVEFRSSTNTGLKTSRAPEGHQIIRGINTTNHIVIAGDYSTQPLYGSFVGAHIAEIPIAYQGRDLALNNARLLAAAPQLLAACYAGVELARNIARRREEQIFLTAINRAIGTVK